MPARIPSYVRTWIISIHKSGMSKTEIFETLQSEGETATNSGIAGVISRFDETRSMNDRPRSGRPVAHQVDIEEIVDRHLKTNDELTARNLQGIILKETGARIPYSTIKSARKKAGWVCAENNFRKFVKKPTGKKRLIFSLKNMKELAVRESDEVLPTNRLTSTSNLHSVNPTCKQRSTQDDKNTSREMNETVEAVDIHDYGHESSSLSLPTSGSSPSGEQQPGFTQIEEHNHHLQLEQRVTRLEALIQDQKATCTRLEQQVQMLTNIISTCNQHGNTKQVTEKCTNQSEVPDTNQTTNTQPLSIPQSSQLKEKSEANHTQPMQYIFKTYLGKRIMFDGKLCYEPTQNLLNEIVRYGHNPPALAREVVRKIFTPYELAVSNVRGYKKVGLDELRVQTVKMLVMKLCNVPTGILDHCWTVCIRAMDQALRNGRKGSRRKQSSLVVSS